MSLFETIKTLQHTPYLGFIHEIFHSKIFNVFVSLIVLFFIVKIIKFLFSKLSYAILKISDDDGRRKQFKTLVDFVQTLAILVVSALYLMTLLSKLGIDIAPILTAAGVLGVAVGFGAKRLVEDIITGVMLLLEGQLRVGDYVKIGQYEGFVERFDLKLVVIRSYSGELHYIRNGMVDVVVNCSREYMNYIGEIGVSYNENIDNVISVLRDIFMTKLKTNPSYAPFILSDIVILGLDKFDDSAIIIKFLIKTKPMMQFFVGREFNRLIKQTFDEKGIEIPFPQRVVHMPKED